MLIVPHNSIRRKRTSMKLTNNKITGTIVAYHAPWHNGIAQSLERNGSIKSATSYSIVNALYLDVRLVFTQQQLMMISNVSLQVLTVRLEQKYILHRIA